MPQSITIRRNSDGKTVETTCATDFSSYWWEHGNGCCDCNRSIFFCEKSGENDEQEGCTEGRYSVRVVDSATGDLIFSDMDAK